MSNTINITWNQSQPAPDYHRFDFTWGTPSIILAWPATSTPYVAPQADQINLTWGTPRYEFSWEGETPYTAPSIVDFTWRPLGDCIRNFVVGVEFQLPTCTDVDFTISYKGVISYAEISIAPTFIAYAEFEYSAYVSWVDVALSLSVNATASRGVASTLSASIELQVAASAQHPNTLNADIPVESDSVYLPVSFNSRQIVSLDLIDSEVVDPYWDNNILLVHMNGAHNGSVFVDEMGSTVARSGSGVLTKTDVKKFGTASAYFPGNGYVYVADSEKFTIGSSDVTLECWMYPTVTPSGNVGIMSQGNNTTFNMSWLVLYRSQGIIAYVGGPTGSWAASATGPSAPQINEWSHVAVTISPSSGKMRVYVNGIGGAEVDGVPSTLFDSTRQVSIGHYNVNPYTGYIDEVRITKGILRYVNNFAVPTSEFARHDIQTYQPEKAFNWHTFVDTSIVDLWDTYYLEKAFNWHTFANVSDAEFWDVYHLNEMFNVNNEYTVDFTGSGEIYDVEYELTKRWFDADLVDSGDVYDAAAFNWITYQTVDLTEESHVYDVSDAFNWHTFVDITDRDIQTSEVFGPQEVLNSTVFINIDLIDDGGIVMIPEEAYNSTVFIETEMLDDSAVKDVYEMYNWRTIVTLGENNFAAVYDPGVVLTLQEIDLDLVDGSSAPLYPYAKNWNTDVFPEWRDSGNVFEPSYTLWHTFVSVGYAEHHDVYGVEHQLTLQEKNVDVIESGEVFSVDYEIHRMDVWVDLLEQDEIYQPAAFNWEQPVSVETQYVDSIYDATVFNWHTYVAAGVVENHSTFNLEAVFNKNREFISESVETGSEVFLPAAFNWEQFLAMAPLESGVVYNVDQIDFRVRRYNAQLVESSSTFGPLQFTNINRSIYLEFADQGSVFGPSSAFNLRTIIGAPNQPVDSSAIYQPTLRNIDSVASVETIESGTVIGVESTEILNKQYFVDLFSDFSVYGPEQVTRFIREYSAWIVIEDHAVLEPEVFALTQTFHGEPYLDESSTFGPDEFVNVDRAFSVDSVESSSVFGLEAAINLDQIVDAGAVELHDVYYVDADNYRRFYQVDITENSTVSLPVCNPPIQAIISGVAYQGEYSVTETFTIDPVHRLFAFAYAGEELACALQAAASDVLSATAYSGQTMHQLSVMDDFVGLSARAYEGFYATAQPLGVEFLIKAYDGSWAVADGLSTDSTVEPIFYAGESLITVFETRPSFGVESTPMYVGETATTTLTQELAGFNLIPAAVTGFCSFSATFSRVPRIIDLGPSCLCSSPKSYDATKLNFDVADVDNYMAVYVSDAWYMFADLATTSHLSGTFRTGENFGQKEEVILGESIAYNTLGDYKVDEPSSLAPKLTTTSTFFWHKLCKGNFVSEGIWVPLEMLSVLDDACIEYRMISGEVMSCVFGSVAIIQPKTSTCGEVADATLTSVMHDVYKGYVSETMLPVVMTTHPAIWPSNMVTGEYSRAEIDEPPSFIYEGASMLVSTLVIEYDVFFTETGSLVNEYIHQTDTGDIDHDRTTINAMESREFRYSFKSECKQ